MFKLMGKLYAQNLCLSCPSSISLSLSGYFWHVTDFHWDFSYWTDELSCHGKNVSNRGPFGNYWCDSPWALVEETVKGMRRIKADVDFILWTG